MKTVKVASFNINSIRVRLESLLEWLKTEQPDILGLQETKAQDKDFPLEPLTEAGYHVYYKGEKGRNGVALLTKTEASDVHFGLDEWGLPDEARLIAVRIGELYVVNTYIPQGREPDTDYFAYKLSWIRHVKDFLARYAKPEHLVLWMGDLNVAPEPIDVHDPKRLLGRVGYHPAEHEAFSYVKEWGLTDVFRRHVPEDKQFTFWDYRVKNAIDRGLGWRIDHILATDSLTKQSKRAWIDTSLRRLPRPSDHTPILAEFELD